MIYLAGSCSSEQRTFMLKIAEFIREQFNEEVYCPFELQIPNAWDYSQEDWAKMVFDKDKEAIDKCDTFIMISPGRISTAGTNWEQGYAFGLGKRVIVFQYTEDKISLMTYCGCTRFVNTDKDAIFDDLRIFFNSVDGKITYTGCKTILT